MLTVTSFVAPDGEEVTESPILTDVEFSGKPMFWQRADAMSPAPREVDSDASLSEYSSDSEQSIEENVEGDTSASKEVVPMIRMRRSSSTTTEILAHAKPTEGDEQEDNSGAAERAAALSPVSNFNSDSSDTDTDSSSSGSSDEEERNNKDQATVNSYLLAVYQRVGRLMRNKRVQPNAREVDVVTTKGDAPPSYGERSNEEEAPPALYGEGNKSESEVVQAAINLMVSPAIQGVARDLARESRIQRLFQQRRGIVQSAMAKDEKLARLKEEQQAMDARQLQQLEAVQDRLHAVEVEENMTTSGAESRALATKKLAIEVELRDVQAKHKAQVAELRGRLEAAALTTEEDSVLHPAQPSKVPMPPGRQSDAAPRPAPARSTPVKDKPKAPSHKLAANRSSSPCRPYAASPKPRAKSCRAGSTIYTGDDRPSPEPRAGEDSVKTPSYAGERSLTPPSPTSSSRASPNGPSRGSLNGKSGHRPRGVSVAQLSPRGQQEEWVKDSELLKSGLQKRELTEQLRKENVEQAQAYQQLIKDTDVRRAELEEQLEKEGKDPERKKVILDAIMELDDNFEQATEDEAARKEREKVPDFGVIIDTEEARVLRGYDAKNMKRKSAVPDKSWADYAEQNKQYRGDLKAHAHQTKAAKAKEKEIRDLEKQRQVERIVFEEQVEQLGKQVVELNNKLQSNNLSDREKFALLEQKLQATTALDACEQLEQEKIAAHATALPVLTAQEKALLRGVRAKRRNQLERQKSGAGAAVCNGQRKTSRRQSETEDMYSAYKSESSQHSLMVSTDAQEGARAQGTDATSEQGLAAMR
uniref:Uncharacterized protein n=1 Tax=Eutreptiella gymnastica TaxID=73025 RepID=A0A7S4GP96_9EUGL|mmetsp:Transcript_48922/g.80407  ORF Transcript_48922/g.80407 Transcript_48922/m.80407 type:complete len:815 (-) Transcript_48922:645-3089(-)